MNASEVEVSFFVSSNGGERVRLKDPYAKGSVILQYDYSKDTALEQAMSVLLQIGRSPSGLTNPKKKNGYLVAATFTF